MLKAAKTLNRVQIIYADSTAREDLSTVCTLEHHPVYLNLEHKSRRSGPKSFYKEKVMPTALQMTFNPMTSTDVHRKYHAEANSSWMASSLSAQIYPNGSPASPSMGAGTHMPVVSNGSVYPFGPSLVTPDIQSSEVPTNPPSARKELNKTKLT
jgi:hypothetical protein